MRLHSWVYFYGCISTSGSPARTSKLIECQNVRNPERNVVVWLNTEIILGKMSKQLKMFFLLFTTIWYVCNSCQLNCAGVNCNEMKFTMKYQSFFCKIAFSWHLNIEIRKLNVAIKQISIPNLNYLGLDSE